MAGHTLVVVLGQEQGQKHHQGQHAGAQGQGKRQLRSPASTVPAPGSHERAGGAELRQRIRPSSLRIAHRGCYRCCGSGRCGRCADSWGGGRDRLSHSRCRRQLSWHGRCCRRCGCHGRDKRGRRRSRRRGNSIQRHGDSADRRRGWPPCRRRKLHRRGLTCRDSSGRRGQQFLRRRGGRRLLCRRGNLRRVLLALLLPVV